MVAGLKYLEYLKSSFLIRLFSPGNLIIIAQVVTLLSYVAIFSVPVNVDLYL